MRILLALVAFAVSAACFGFFAFCAYMAVTELGLIEGVTQILADWANIAVMGGCFLLGSTFLVTGAILLFQRPSATA